MNDNSIDNCNNSCISNCTNNCNNNCSNNCINNCINNCNNNCDTEVDSSMSDYFAESGYKFILAVGLLVGETPRLKTVCAERGGVEVVLECLKQRKRSSSVCKWGLWALMVSKFEKLLHS